MQCPKTGQNANAGSATLICLYNVAGAWASTIIAKGCSGAGLSTTIWHSWTGIDAHAPGHNPVMSTCYPSDSVVAGPQRFIVDEKRVETFPGSALGIPHT